MLKNPCKDEQKLRCCEETLQSEIKGHFSNFCAMVADANPGMMEEFQKMDTDEERIMFCTMLKKVNNFIVKPVFKKKDAELSKTKRNEGNAAYSKKRYKQAMMLYTVSAVKAPNTAVDNSLAYAIANRSACLYYMGDMKHAIQDVEFALSLGYPDQLKYKLWERKAKCLVQLKQFDKARVALNSAKKTLEANKLKLDEKKLSQATKALKELMAVIVDEGSIKGEIIMVEEDKDPVQPKLTGGHNKKIRNISNLLKVVHDPGVGRHVVANKAVASGDTLVVEDPLSAVLYPDKLGSHCDNCFIKLRSAVPCPNCAGVAYCSVVCRDQAQPYHRYECQFSDLMLGLGSSALVRLAYRIVASKSLKFFNNIKTQLNVDETSVEQSGALPTSNIQGVTKDMYGTYLATFNLVGMDDQRWPEDKFNRSLMAVCLLKILKAARYFPDKSDEDSFTQDELFIGSLLMRHINILQFNAHEIYELIRGDRGRLKPNKNSLLGVGIYPQSSYFNHSCHPTSARYNIGKKMIVKSLAPVAPGQEVSENYGPVFYFNNKQDRQKQLESRYWFSCECKACRDDWPLLKENTEVRWKDKDDSASLDDLKTLYDCGVAMMDDGQTKEAEESFTDYINQMYGLVEPPLEVLTRAEDKLRTCCNNMGTVVFQDMMLKTNPAEKSNNLMIK